MKKNISLPYSIRIYLFIYLTGTFFSLAVAYVRVNYLEANPRIGQILTAADKSGVISDFAYKNEKYSFGVHYFSDFTEALLKSQARSPYVSPPNNLPVSNYPPFGQAILIPFSYFSYRISVLFFLMFMTAGLVSAFLFALKRFRTYEGVAFLILGVFGSTPVLFLLDRGNYWGFTAALALWAVLIGLKGHWKWSGLLIAVAASLKVFPLLLLLWVWRRSNFRNIIPGLLTGLLLSIGSVFLFKGSVIDNLLGFFHAQETVHGNLGGSHTYQSLNNSMLAFFLNLEGSSVPLFYRTGQVLVQNYLVVVAAILVFSIGSFMRKQERVISAFFGLTLLVCLISFLPPVVFSYGLSLYLLPLVFLLFSEEEVKRSNFCFVLIALLFINKVPFAPYLSSQTGSNLVNPVIQILILITCLINLLRSEFLLDPVCNDPTEVETC